MSQPGSPRDEHFDNNSFNNNMELPAEQNWNQNAKPKGTKSVPKAASKRTTVKTTGDAGAKSEDKGDSSKRAKTALKTFLSSVMSTLGLIVLVLGYCILGGGVFQWLEQNDETTAIRNSREAAEATIKQYAADLYASLQRSSEDEVSIDVVRTINDQLRLLSAEAYVMGDSGSWDGLKQSQKVNNDWTFFGALLFSVTTLTTIGYGVIAPTTTTGRVICVFYSIFGIPIMLLAISYLGSWCANQVRAIHRAVTRFRSTSDFDESVVTEVPVIVSLLIMVGYIFAGAAMFSAFEDDLEFLDAAYFCFITLTTIGFGDIVPGVYSGKTTIAALDGQETTQTQDIYTTLKLILCGLYLFFGLSLLAMCMDLMKEEVAANFLWLGYKTNLMKQQSSDAVIEEYIKSQKAG